jgi:hypothetical protein
MVATNAAGDARFFGSAAKAPPDKPVVAVATAPGEEATMSQRRDPPGERVVLARKTPDSMVRFQWTGAEPEGVDSIDFAVSCGAVWEGDELVTHNLLAFEHNVRHSPDGFLEDSD